MTDTTSMPKIGLPISKSFGGLLLALLITCLAYSGGLSEIIRRWTSEDEYGHGPLLLLLAVFFAYQKRAEIAASPSGHNSVGLVLIITSSLLFIAGEVSALYLLVHYSFVCTLYGVFVCLYGISVTRHITPSLLLLVFAIPIPYFFQTELTINLQLISSWIGVFIIKLFSIPVFLEGNVIDLGIMKLQVVEACAGLRYMFSLLSFGFICAYIYHVEMWKRVFIFFSTIPITILMNSARIAAVGVLVNRVGTEMAEGFTHEFQGISIFVICLALLFSEMWILTKIGSRKREFRNVFGLDFSEQQALSAPTSARSLTRVFIAGLITIILASVAVSRFEQRQENVPKRQLLIRFPTQINEWTGSGQKLGSGVLEKLKLTDYISADYRRSGSNIPVNFYIAYYESQRKGASPHSPRVCIPGGGWEISEISRQTHQLTSENQILRFNRAIIKKGNSKQLVYYWFQQRGRMISNEYLMKWYLLKDALIDNRTDGALVRLVTPFLPYEDEQDADKRLLMFANQTAPLLHDYIPD
jgi:exosortase D (VPLPA-CTERM-specific)